MQRTIYSIRDVKAGEYLGLVIFRNEAEAQRFYLQTVTDKRGHMWKFPRDYAIYELGGVDVVSGVIERAPVPKDVTPYSVIDSFVEMITNVENYAQKSPKGEKPALKLEA